MQTSGLGDVLPACLRVCEHVALRGGGGDTCICARVGVNLEGLLAGKL